MSHSIESYKDAKNETRWRIKANGHIVADSGEGYKNEKDALTALFGIYFGEYDESFLALYSQWQSYEGTPPSPEAYVRREDVLEHERRDADAPNYEATQQDSALPVVEVRAEFSGEGGGLQPPLPGV
jgi:uncharacterized protein YegP (UPF0339 family)